MASQAYERVLAARRKLGILRGAKGGRGRSAKKGSPKRKGKRRAKRAKGKRTAKQKAATRRMLAANKRARRKR